MTRLKGAQCTRRKKTNASANVHVLFLNLWLCIQLETLIYFPSLEAYVVGHLKRQRKKKQREGNSPLHTLMTCPNGCGAGATFKMSSHVKTAQLKVKHSSKQSHSSNTRVSCNGCQQNESAQTKVCQKLFLITPSSPELYCLKKKTLKAWCMW